MGTLRTINIVQTQSYMYSQVLNYECLKSFFFFFFWLIECLIKYLKSSITDDFAYTEEVALLVGLRKYGYVNARKSYLYFSCFIGRYFEMNSF